MEDDLNERLPQWKATLKGDNLNGRQPQWHAYQLMATSMEHNLHEDNFNENNPSER